MDDYTRAAAKLFNVPESDVTDEMRARAKTIGFAAHHARPSQDPNTLPAGREPNIVDALRAVAEVGQYPPVTRRNRVPWLLAHCDIVHGWVLVLNVVDDSEEPFGVPLNSHGAPRQQMWSTALRVESVEDIPAVVAKLYERVTAQLLNLPAPAEA